MRVRSIVLALVISCGPAQTIRPGEPRPLKIDATSAIDTTPKERRRLIPTEVYLRAYLTWFGGLVPLEVQQRAKARGLFDAWADYLAALGLPDAKLDLPRASQSNTLMLATLGRLGEALCIRAAEHDRKAPPDERVVFAFDLSTPPDDAAFTERFDVLHRLFLGYPVRLAPPDRIARFHALYAEIVARHERTKKPLLTPDETAWAGMCSALVQHPEAELY